jgi:ankyrin repeat protein
MEILDKLSVRYRSSWAEVSTSLLIEASKIGEVRQLDILLQRPDIHPNSRDADGCTALSWSARKGHEKFVERLLGDGRVDVNLKDNLGRTALMWAASEGRGEATKLLLDCPGIDINGKDVQGKTALQLADNNGHGARFQQLMKERRAGHSRT